MDAPTATSDTPRAARPALAPSLETALRVLLAPLAELGALGRLLLEAVRQGLRPPYRWRLLVRHIEFIGVGSLFLVGLTGFFVGAVLGLQLVDGFRQFRAENQTGAVVALALTRELAPVFTALMVTSRAGSAIATELGSMKVTQQVDALLMMAVEPVQYLVSPRLLAAAVSLPVLTMLFTLVAMLGAYGVAVGLMGIDPGIFLARARWLVDPPDVAQGLLKALVFGVALTLVACRQGLDARGGAAGVGRATNRAVVHAAVLILALDYVLTSLVLGAGAPF